MLLKKPLKKCFSQRRKAATHLRLCERKKSKVFEENAEYILVPDRTPAREIHNFDGRFRGRTRRNARGSQGHPDVCFDGVPNVCNSTRWGVSQVGDPVLAVSSGAG
jgi:hypothetical protein